MSSIVCSRLSFAWPDDTPLFDDLSVTVGPGRTGLVAPNGAGKSTLLKLVAGEYRPTSGTVTVDGTLGYLPQTLPFVADRTVAEVLGVAPIIAALNALAAGEAGDDVFAAIGEDWDIEERTRAQLDRLGLGHIALDRALGSLSGGEVVSVGLAGELLKRPDVLLLDEPTNNLDADARHKLYDALDDYTGCLLLVSHDRVLLDRMDRIAELRRGEILLYGGNFTMYTEAVNEAQRVAESTLRSAEQQLKREKRDMQVARERAARRASTAARNLKDAGLPKIVAGARKRRAQESAGRADDVHAARVGDARARLDDAERSLRSDDAIVLDLPQTDVPAGRTLLTLEGVAVRRGGRTLFADVDLSVRGPERIALTGHNGAGKSTLLRVIDGTQAPDAGAVRRADVRVAYLSQRLDLLDPRHSVAESLATFAPGLSDTRRRHLLAQFLFRGDRIHLPIGALSGGERLRATLACVLHREPAPHLLLLDEPTNNLDLVSVGQLQSALTAYRGAFIVVSHDERFLAEIGVQRWFRLSGGRVQPA
ncbi:ABC-F family ATP-binding cassette domain-containing protein [Mycolicibacterium holsaticum]|uniref:ABC-F family ATP-binding cassette domain-containing protein n=1 Tax=Mycolicibacterium holsaticum TaxID=152142 RepID=UPI001C7D0D7C|nr:ABC-F family ATP-binding cassette domain-containing protein [Mycolicibacterium holsaticum]MDA4105860.1 ABC transporter [Mycolicibacterium holsaticum DSM 44478 = JCM 12374]QZA13787.1 ATP-binding cassette domain-containing protein [Mycolicibacterium holsaticum DSM 44478 = JCM 12374]UNC08752.1 ABC-F family ATP-binding cassette domain-containing protein [Mycolicibacterium holsaticum DSM 44478 = JCM 12374]